MTKLSKDREFRIKWACTNMPYIDFANVDGDDKISNRIFLTKNDVVTIIKEMQEFVDFYKQEFSPSRIDQTNYD